MDVISFIPEDYSPAFSAGEFKPSIPDDVIRRALEKIAGEPVTLQGGNKAKLKDGSLICYRVTQQTKRSPNPWYSISESTLDKLNNDGITDIYTLFFVDTERSSYDLYYEIFEVRRINQQPPKYAKYAITNSNHHWKCSEDNSNLYRYNPKTTDMNNTFTSVKKGGVRKNQGEKNETEQ